MEEIKCPGCKAEFKAPIYQCSSGHSLCKACIDTVQTCPKCKTGLPKTKLRNWTLEEVVISLTLVPCPFKSKGCTVRVVPNSLPKHTKKCEFAPENYCSLLGIPKCKTCLTVAEWIAHAQDDHNLPALFAKLGQEFEIRKEFEYEPTGAKKIPAIVLKSAAIVVQGKKKETFWLRFRPCTGENIAVAIMEHENNETSSSYTVNITSFSEQVPGTSITWKGPVMKPKESLNNEGACVIPWQRIKDFSQWTLRISITQGKYTATKPDVSKLIIKEYPRAKEPSSAKVSKPYESLRQSSSSGSFSTDKIQSQDPVGQLSSSSREEKFLAEIKKLQAQPPGRCGICFEHCSGTQMIGGLCCFCASSNSALPLPK